MKLSAVIITKNEEDNIERCIDSLSFADEVIVVDAESNDKTVAMAKAKGAKTFVRPWPGYGSQKNFGAAQAQGEWLLFLDADEVISPKLAQEISKTLQSPTADFYWQRIVTYFLGKPLNHLYGHNLRLFKKSAGSWTGHHVHEHVQTNSGDVISLGDAIAPTLKHPIYHYSHATISAYLKRMAEYTALDAQRMATYGKHRSGRKVTPSFFLPYYLMLRQFVKLYGYRKGFLDGLVGLQWSALSGYYEYVMGKKYLRIKHGERKQHEAVLR